MNHDDFFALAIDPDEAPDPALEPEIDEHRRTCAECRELEQDYPKILELGRSLPDSVRDEARASLRTGSAP